MVEAVNVLRHQAGNDRGVLQSSERVVTCIRERVAYRGIAEVGAKPVPLSVERSPKVSRPQRKGAKHLNRCPTGVGSTNSW